MIYVFPGVGLILYMGYIGMRYFFQRTWLLFSLIQRDYRTLSSKLVDTVGYWTQNQLPTSQFIKTPELMNNFITELLSNLYSTLIRSI